MTPVPISPWFDLLQQDCAHTPGTQLFFILDQACCPVPLWRNITSVISPQAVHSLFTGLPEAHLIDLAPLLIEVDLNEPLQRLWFENLLTTVDPRSGVLALHSPWPFRDLCQFFGHCMEARFGGAVGLFRYYDPRIFPPLMRDVLEPEQRQRLLRPAISWCWLDRDGMPQRLAGLAEPPEFVDKQDPFELTDPQLETLGCVADATAALRTFVDGVPDCESEQTFQRCYAAMLEATRIGLIVDSQRQAFALEQLSKGEPV
ncbi:DUF4123 domain-containing protein [Pseudomonas turukhanskensis]|uniref:DUF4123 domain-containing protein n=1 Tax=Pseudomonas turukhanskensis TaxID=1806536 RepID=A0A9W6NG10_9PSED|nr:DUF4123 domain-containing protein [Pseudomonas turukhanskensis]GLK90279.1 hypothetical protein GCM10017655_33420 [Pseudomonas turukhanskensis]